MADQAPPNPVKSVSKEEMEVAYGGPAPFANRFFVTIAGPVARIAFAEMGKGIEPQFRTAVTMTAGDLIQLRDVLIGLTKNMATIQITKN